MKKTLLAASLLCISAIAQADVLYTSGTGSSSGNNPFSYDDIFVAQPFNFATDSVIDSFTFNAFTTESTVAVEDVFLKFYQNNAGAVGTELFSGTFDIASQSVTGNNGSYTLQDYTINLGGVNLAAGDYFVGVRATPAQWDLHWSMVDGQSTGFLGNATGDAAAYTNQTYTHVFALNGAPVPEPETYAMMALGLAGLAFMRKRRQAA